MLRSDERALLAVYCHDHVVAVCPDCSEGLSFDRIGTDVVTGQRDFCPVCRADLTTALRKHLAECTRPRIDGVARIDEPPDAALNLAPPGTA